MSSSIGAILHFWAYDDADQLNPTAARNLAAELTRWADEQDRRAAAAADPEQVDLFELIEEGP